MDKKEIKITDKSRIFRYEGKEGLLKVTKNSLKARGELLTYEISYASLNTFLEKNKAEEIRKGFLEKGIRIREITNVAYHEHYTDIPDFHEKVMNIRYVNSSRLKIKTEMLIYNDIVVFYSVEEPIYAIEVHDAELAEMQKQIYEFVWSSGERPVIGKNGRSSMF